jgi:ketosteroid isomerase-like protein
LPTSIELVERIYEASATGDLEALVAMAAPDLVIEQDPALPWGGRCEGPGGVVGYFQRLAGTVDTGATYDIPECHVSTVVDDQVTDVRFFIDSTSMLEALAR